ncbi:MAG TPA: Re/Si-specific NAD(P)(+) transhydrogenase subunit alpha [Saprospiraceae bacterium]|nr:Re/Si-specific NAD(P)(+) transhydrogenase subunit alpha [Saprospiraceae bacterium]
MKVAVLKEDAPETRVSLLPEHVQSLTKLNCEVLIESGAGILSAAVDQDYVDAGAKVVDLASIKDQADIILVINPPQFEDLRATRAKVILGMFQPLNFPQKLEEYGQGSAAIFSMDMLPRTTRAQSMDVLSSQANIAGYKAVLVAANEYPRYFPMFMTAAGTIKPAKVLILGAGVAGLQAIATAKRLGAVVEVFDTRPAVKEEVMSLGAKFVEVEGAADATAAGGYAVEQSEDYKARQQERINESVAKADIIITTAQIPGRKAPILITDAMINRMKQGSVIIDLAASTGGNTTITQDNATVVERGIKVVGNSNLPSAMPSDASKVYGKNILNFLALIIDKEGNLNLNFEDDLVKGTCVLNEGKITNERILALMPVTN